MCAVGNWGYHDLAGFGMIDHDLSWMVGDGKRGIKNARIGRETLRMRASACISASTPAVAVTASSKQPLEGKHGYDTFPEVFHIDLFRSTGLVELSLGYLPLDGFDISFMTFSTVYLALSVGCL